MTPEEVIAKAIQVWNDPARAGVEPDEDCHDLAYRVLEALKAHHLYVVGTGAIAPAPRPFTRDHLGDGLDYLDDPYRPNFH